MPSIKDMDKMKLLERSCYKCNKILTIEEFSNTNAHLSLDEIFEMWQNPLVELYCCHCFHRSHNDENNINNNLATNFPDLSNTIPNTISMIPTNVTEYTAISMIPTNVTEYTAISFEFPLSNWEQLTTLRFVNVTINGISMDITMEDVKSACKQEDCWCKIPTLCHMCQYFKPINMKERFDKIKKDLGVE